MATPVLLLIAVATGLYATINLGNAETKYGAMELFKEKVHNFYVKELSDECLGTAEYSVNEKGEHTFTCSTKSLSGGKKTKKNKKSKKLRKSRKFRK